MIRNTMVLFGLRAVGTLVVAATCWILLGFLVAGLLGSIYGWAGHPAMPAAPIPVYVAIHLVGLLALCLLAGWKVVRWVGTRSGAVRRCDGRHRASNPR